MYFFLCLNTVLCSSSYLYARSLHRRKGEGFSTDESPFKNCGNCGETGNLSLWSFIYNFIFYHLCIGRQYSFVAGNSS